MNEHPLEGTRAKRISQLDGLRAFAFFSVFLFHSAKTPPKLVLWAGVDLFFVLSGFLITGILLDSSSQQLSIYFGRFYWKRARRILPPYALAVIFAAAFFPIHLAHLWGWYTFFVSNIGQAFGADIQAPMTTFWSLAVEEQFYLFWPAVIVTLRVKILERLCITGLVVVPVLRLLCSPMLSSSGGIFLLTPFRLDLLMAGSLLAIAWRRNGATMPCSWKRLSLPALFASLVTYSLLCLEPGFERDSGSLLFDGFGYSLILCFCAALLTIVLSLPSESVFYRLLCFGPIAYLGRISYVMYLVHSTCILLSVKYLNSYGHILSRSVALLSTVALGSISWQFMERYLLDTRSRAAVLRHSLVRI